MRISLLHFAAIGFVFGSTIGVPAQAPQEDARLHAPQPSQAQASQTASPQAAQHAPREAADNPVADPKAVVSLGNARFTVLTPELIRMEWAADGKFEDHASFVFLNRRLPVPKFTRVRTKSVPKLGRSRSDQHRCLDVHYTSRTTGDRQRFTPENLTIELTVDGKPVTWHPGDTDPENLQGTTRTLDGARGIEDERADRQGLVSRSGWAVVDDSTRPLFDSADFSFKRRRKEPVALGDGAARRRAAGPVLLWLRTRLRESARRLCSRRRTHSAAAAVRLRRVVVALLGLQRPGTRRDRPQGFHENDVPLDVFVIDMGWHISQEQLRLRWATSDQSGHDLGWTGYTWNKVLFPDPDAFLDRSFMPKD